MVPAPLLVLCSLPGLVKIAWTSQDRMAQGEDCASLKKNLPLFCLSQLSPSNTFARGSLQDGSSGRVTSPYVPFPFTYWVGTSFSGDTGLAMWLASANVTWAVLKHGKEIVFTGRCSAQTLIVPWHRWYPFALGTAYNLKLVKNHGAETSLTWGPSDWKRAGKESLVSWWRKEKQRHKPNVLYGRGSWTNNWHPLAFWVGAEETVVQNHVTCH